jgi:hypothetical protein
MSGDSEGNYYRPLNEYGIGGVCKARPDLNDLVDEPEDDDEFGQKELENAVDAFVIYPAD